MTHTIGQFMIGGFFLITLIKNLTSWKTNVAMVDEVLPFPGIALGLGFLLEFAGAMLLVLNLDVQLGAALLIAFTVLATVLFLRFWSEKEPVRQNYHAILFFNNLAIIGGLLLLL